MRRYNTVTYFYSVEAKSQSLNTFLSGGEFKLHHPHEECVLPLQEQLEVLYFA